MSTSPIARGQLAELALATQTDFTTPAANGYTGAFFYSSSLGEDVPSEVDPVLGGARHNARDTQNLTAGLSAHAGEVAVPLCVAGIGHWLKTALAAPVTTGTTDKTHVFTSGSDTLPSTTIEQKVRNADFRRHTGCVATSLKLDLQPEAGFQRVMFGFVGREETMLGASGAGAFTTPARESLEKTLGQVLLNGTMIGVLLSANLEYQTGVKPERYLNGSAKVSAAVIDDPARAMGEIRIRYTGQAIQTLAVNRTDSTLTFRWEKSATRGLDLALASAVLGRAKSVINGPGGIEATHSFEAKQTTAAAMLTATLKNAVASY